LIELTRGSITEPDDLDIQVVDANGSPIDPYRISYALFDVTGVDGSSSLPGVEVLIGPSERTPVRKELGTYYAHFQVPENAPFGLYRIRWTLQETTTSPEFSAMQEFHVISPSQFGTQMLSAVQLDMIRRMRILLRDQNPDRFYHFRPPTSSGTINQFNRVFAHIWEDEELLEYMEQAVFAINASPPMTTFKSLDNMVQSQRNWIPWIITGAMVHACVALSLNWIADEFSIGGEVPVRILLPDGRELDVPIEELYEICEGEELSQADKQSIKDAYKSGKLKAVSVDPETSQVVTKVVTRVLRHSTLDKAMVRLKTVQGRKATFTVDHSLFTWEDQKIRPVQAGALDIGSEIVVVDSGHASREVVDEIESIPSRVYTYDLSVPGPENFVLSNGILAHNSYSVGGISLDIEKSSKYESLKNNAEGRFDKMMENKTRTVKIMRGLQQSRYGLGVRSAFGPHTGSGVMTPRKFIGV
jgi:hypothetical protein